jgi:hypothetical protein
MLVLIILLQIGSDKGFEKNFVPITGTILNQETAPYQKLGLTLGLGYTHYRYFPHDRDFPYLPDPRITIHYRFYDGKILNPLIRNFLATRIIGRIGVYPKQSRTDRHLPYLALGVGITLTDESIFIPRIAVNIMANRVRDFTILPTDPYYRIRIDRGDSYQVGFEIRKLIGGFQVTAMLLYLRSMVKGIYRGYIPPEEPERSYLAGFSEFNFDRPIEKQGVGFSLSFRKFSLSISHLSFWHFAIIYQLRG